MIEGILALIGLLGLFIMFILKGYNVTKFARFYPKIFIFFGLAIVLISWLLVLYSLAGSINTTQTTTITDGAKTWTITPTNNYWTMTLILNLANVFLILNGLFFLIEIIMLFVPPSQAEKALDRKQKRTYLGYPRRIT